MRVRDHAALALVLLVAFLAVLTVWAALRRQPETRATENQAVTRGPSAWKPLKVPERFGEEDLETIRETREAAEKAAPFRDSEIGQAEIRQRTLRGGVVIWQNRSRRIVVANYTDGRPRYVRSEGLRSDGTWVEHGLGVRFGGDGTLTETFFCDGAPIPSPKP